MRKKITRILLLLPFLFFSSCKKESILETGRLNVYLTDTNIPPGYDEINLDIRSVEARIGGSTGGDWHSVRTRPGIYNMLRVTGGIDTLIAYETLPTGEIMQLRMDLGENNSVKKDGVLYPLVLSETGKNNLTIEVEAMIASGSTRNVILDFDAGRSIVYQNNGYYLHPFFR
jgi:hypothetical protein